MKRFLLSLLMLVYASAYAADASKDVVVNPDVLYFNGINASNSFSINVEKGPKCRIEIIIDETLEPYLIVEVKNGELRLSLDNKTPKHIRNNSGRRTLKANITMPKLNKIDLGGACKFESKDVWEANEFEIDCSGASNVKDLNLKVREIDIDLSGASDFTGNVDFDKCSIDISGASNCNLTGKGEKVDAELAGASKCTLAGSSDSLEIEASGASAVVAKNFEVKKVYVQVSGASSANLYATESINAQASGASSINYKASSNVQVREHKSGGSSIVRK